MPEQAVAEVPEITEGGESRATAAATAILDKIAPLPKGVQPEPATLEPEPPKPKEKAVPSEPAKGKILPSFLQKTVEKPAAVPAPAPASEDWPEELPGTKDIKVQGNWKRFREQYSSRGAEVTKLQKEIDTLRQTTGKADPQLTERMTQLEKDNSELLGYVERYSLQNHPKFVAQIDQPLQRAVAAAKSILQDAGGDPASLDNVFSATGKQRYEILDEVTAGLPEAAKGELLATMKDIRAIEARRQQILSDPKRTMEHLRKEDIESQRQQIQTQTKQLDDTLSDIVNQLREVDKLEVLQRTSDPKETWWNDQGEQIVSIAREILHSPDPKRLTAAIVLGASADVYRELFQDAMVRAEKAEGELKSLRGKEPSMERESGEETESGEDDVKKPFSELFIQKLQRQRNR
jgi:hypothetical protein